MRKSHIYLISILLVSIFLILHVVSEILKDTDKEDRYVYACTATTTTINRDKGYVGFTDKRGKEWFWYIDSSLWELEDTVLLVIDNNGTNYIYDDTIVSITTEGIFLNTVY